MMNRYFVCKTCGRGLVAYEQPSFCYADRMDTMEEINEEDSRKMGLFAGLVVSLATRDHAYEFPGDVLYHPFTGESEKALLRGYRLDDFQAGVMEAVRAN